MAGCDEPEYDYGDFLEVIAVYEGAGVDGSGSVFAYQARNDSPVVTLHSSSMISGVRKGERVLLRYTVVDDLSGEEKKIRVDGVSRIVCDVLRQVDGSVYDVLDSTPIDMTSIWRSGNYINDGGNDADIDFNGYSYTANMMDAAEANGGLSADDPAGYPAAFYVSNYTAAPSGTSGWFLPSASQLKTLKAQKEALNAKEGFTPFLEGESDYYWSSSESTYLGGAPMMYSLIVCFGEQGEFGSIFDEVKDYGSHHVRAILAF